MPASLTRGRRRARNHSSGRAIERYRGLDNRRSDFRRLRASERFRGSCEPFHTGRTYGKNRDRQQPESFCGIAIDRHRQQRESPRPLVAAATRCAPRRSLLAAEPLAFEAL